MARRLAEMRRNAAARGGPQRGSAPRKRQPRDTVVASLGHRGVEVLERAEAQHPDAVRVIVEKIAEVIDSGELRGPVSGGELLALFAAVGLRVRMETRISVKSDGKLVPLSEKLRSSRDAGAE